VEAVLQIIRGVVPPGVYDLVSNPQWSWHRVYEYEARRIGRPFLAEPVSEGQASGRFASLIGTGKHLLRRARATALRVDGLREMGRSVLSRVPTAWSSRAEAIYRVQRAAREAAQIFDRAPSLAAMSWGRLDRRPLAPLSDPAVLMQDPDSDLRLYRPGHAFPPDLPAAAHLDVSATAA